jgi:CheY-like chemotaxis protein
VGRHRYLSEHLGAVFRDFGLETLCAVGLDDALAAARPVPPDVVLCDYDLLATGSLERWERDDFLARCPVVAVSLTRRPAEQHLLDVNGIAGFLYLPTLTRENALKALAGARRRPVPSFSLGSTALDWPRTTSPAPAR